MPPTPEEIEMVAHELADHDGMLREDMPKHYDALASRLLEAAEEVRPQPIGYRVFDKDGNDNRLDIYPTLQEAHVSRHEQDREFRHEGAPHRVIALVPVGEVE